MLNPTLPPTKPNSASSHRLELEGTTCEVGATLQSPPTKRSRGRQADYEEVAPNVSEREGESTHESVFKEAWWKRNIGMLSRRDVHGGEARACLRIVLREVECRHVTMTRDRVRVVGSCPTLGAWKVEGGADLLWQGGEWVSLLIEVPARSVVEFCILRSTSRHRESEWTYKWSQTYTVEAPHDNTVLELRLSSGQELQEQAIPRASFLARPLQDLHAPGEQRCYTFDSHKGVTIHYALYLPPALCGCADVTKVPLVIFLHAMYNRLDGDNSLFYDSDTPPRLLLDGGIDGEVPAALQNFVVLSPQCPPDPAWCDGVGTWFRQGWYTDNERPDPGSETALWELVDAVCSACKVDMDRICLTGCSMGALACLKLVVGRPKFFAAVVPVAAYYEDDLEELVGMLSLASSVPFWFVHAENDQSCPFSTIRELVRLMRSSSFAEVHITSYEDTWSKTGHASDCVAYMSGPCAFIDQPFTMGNKVFDWLFQHRRSDNV